MNTATEASVNKGVTIEPLEHWIRDGDWHDRPFRYSVKGPGKEVQNFPTKMEAQAYARIRRNAPNQLVAIRASSCADLVRLLKL